MPGRSPGGAPEIIVVRSGGRIIPAAAPVVGGRFCLCRRGRVGAVVALCRWRRGWGCCCPCGWGGCRSGLLQPLPLLSFCTGNPAAARVVLRGRGKSGVIVLWDRGGALLLLRGLPQLPFWRDETASVACVWRDQGFSAQLRMVGLCTCTPNSAALARMRCANAAFRSSGA